MSLILPISGFFNPSWGLNVRSAWVNIPDSLPIVLENILLYHSHWRTSNFLLPTFTTSDPTSGGCGASFSFFFPNHHFTLLFIRAKNPFLGSSWAIWCWSVWWDSSWIVWGVSGWWAATGSWAAWGAACVSEWKVNVSAEEIGTHGTLGATDADQIDFLEPCDKIPPSSHFFNIWEACTPEVEWFMWSVLRVAVERI